MPVTHFARQDGYSGGSYRCELCRNMRLDHKTPNSRCPASDQPTIDAKPLPYTNVPESI